MCLWDDDHISRVVRPLVGANERSNRIILIDEVGDGGKGVLTLAVVDEQAKWTLIIFRRVIVHGSFFDMLVRAWVLVGDEPDVGSGLS